eukprot:CAMPEP_0206247580 /NCGR_PEP_ID=MMETSP0047_2-20121206/19889_1 /ASSEMBLY_ACC=CAM_ASM_000192 /TAXON_ID=195065 /ORGANISM="Chroomonas mesostigmatica_cf, Strain CCMP1168" /LENGTH=198 /DNA_ID=CAMNT_0053673121 /DNA_START=55 /DNA_END=651 /DNA_ORIENTATION=+
MKAAGAIEAPGATRDGAMGGHTHGGADPSSRGTGTDRPSAHAGLSAGETILLRVHPSEMRRPLSPTRFMYRDECYKRLSMFLDEFRTKRARLAALGSDDGYDSSCEETEAGSCQGQGPEAQPAPRPVLAAFHGTRGLWSSCSQSIEASVGLPRLKHHGSDSRMEKEGGACQANSGTIAYLIDGLKGVSVPPNFFDVIQ